MTGCGIKNTPRQDISPQNTVPVKETQTQDNNKQASQQNETVPKSTLSPAYSTSQSNVSVSLEQAKQIALQKVPGATEQNLAIHLDFDDGFYVYEGDIWYDRMEYEFDIDANSGTILKREQEYWR